MLKHCLVALTVVLISACASGPELEKYPRTQIDRPYTLPDGVATWRTPIVTWYEKDNTDSYFIPPIPVPLLWQSSLTDNLTLNWSPFPLSLSHQWFDSGAHLLGATYGLGVGYATDLGWLFTGSLSFYYRQRLAKQWALETTPSITGTYLTKVSPTRWAFGVGVGPLWQVTETFTLSPKAAIRVQEGFRENTFAGELKVTQSNATRVVFPLSLTAEWSFDRQWDASLNYVYSRLGHDRGYESHLGTLTFTHFW